MTTYRLRPATLADVPAIHALVRACGTVDTDADAIAADFARDGLDPARDTLLVVDDTGALAARAWVDRRSEADVHPAHCGRGLGTQLLEWIEARAREAGAGKVTQTVPDDDLAAVALLRSRGWTPMVQSWELEMALPDEPAVPGSPDAITVRPFAPGDALRAYQMIQDAFGEWRERRQPFEEWAAATIGRGAFAPQMSPLAWHGDELVGAALAMNNGVIDEVAVRRDHRNRGIARLLLRHAFRAFHRRGLRAGTLWTHSDTGALDLYLRVGMSVRRSATVFVKPVRPQP